MRRALNTPLLDKGVPVLIERLKSKVKTKYQGTPEDSGLIGGRFPKVPEIAISQGCPCGAFGKERQHLQAALSK